MKIVVIGGSGQIGSKLIKKLLAQGHTAVAASTRSGINTFTGEGLADVLKAASVVVDVSNSHSFDPKEVMEFFQTSTRNLLTYEAAAGVGHHVALSIVGMDRQVPPPYFRAKLAQEKLIQESPVPYTILRATQFFEFFPAIADSFTQDNQVRVPAALIQPVAGEDVAGALARIAAGRPLKRVEIGGPERFTFEEFICLGLNARSDPREVIVDPKAQYFGEELKERTLIAGDNAWAGETHFKTWLGLVPAQR
jgi:uncharacterized protein YbjT (DUF2867 family)